MDNIGILIAGRLTSALSVCSNISYLELEKRVYHEFLSIAAETVPGDWIELPNGARFVRASKATPRAVPEPDPAVIGNDLEGRN
jgi:hypothetical protein